MKGPKPYQFSKEQDEFIKTLFDDDNLSRSDILEQFKRRYKTFNKSFDVLKRRFNYLTENGKNI